MMRSALNGWVTAAVISFLLLTTNADTSNAQGEEVLLESDEIGVEVLLNDPNVTINLSLIADLIVAGNVTLPGFDPSMNMDISSIDLSFSTFLLWSHHDPDLGVIISWENFEELLHGIDPKPNMKGWSLSILIPGTYVYPDPSNYFEAKVKPDIDKDPEEFDWKKVMEVELDWLISEGVIHGLDESDVENITGLTELGTMGLNKRVFFYQFTGEWMLYDRSPLPELEMVFGAHGTFPGSMFPDQTTPAPDNEEKISAGLMIFISSGLVLLLIGSYLYQRVNRAVNLNNARRKMIYERIRQNPGIHFSALMKDLDLKPGVTSYHINRLEKMEFIKSFQDGMYRRFFLFEDKVETKVMLSELQKLILTTVQDEPGISQVNISRLIGRSKVVINYHVRFLRDLGTLVIERDGRETHCYLTPQGSRFASE